ncbi:GTPase [Winogradskyella endarachnes]|uniref:GTPase n=1 Tax=Winogradskyella endarachnes TaxID=2681965 RepID=A0A6L6U895_9FLAO|nr:GTPase [Winogradskyella endarachnes]MUU77766.1 GTPase [Winogradskyella endarachnes]
MFDAVHKLFSPSTYQCSLCALTHDVFWENKTWKNFRLQTNFEMVFYHKNEFEAKFCKVDVAYPIILKLENNKLTTVLIAEVLNEITSIEALIERINSRI